MNFKYFISMLPFPIIKRAFEIYFSNYDFSKREWYKELNQTILKMVDCIG